MRWLSDVLFRLRAVFSRRQMEADLHDEVAFHIEREAEKLVAGGMPEGEARRVASVRFGGEERFKESTREAWGVAPVTDFFGDVRFAGRQLRKRPAFTALASLTLALGIGGTVALFSVVSGLMLRPLPVQDEASLVTFWSDYDWRGEEFDLVRENVQAFEDVAAYSDDATTLRTETGSRLLLLSVGSAGLFDVLGTSPLLGRTFRTGEDRPGAEPVVVLSHRLWERDFASDRDVLGRRIDLGGTVRTVIGVMPDGFYFPSPESEAWVPLDLDPASSEYQDNGWLVLTARIRAGVTPEQVDDDLARVAGVLGERWDYPEAWDKTRDPYVVPSREYLLGDVRAPLLLLLGAVGLVLLMACANVAALLVTRTSDRTDEMSVRTALGAGRGRLARQILTESVLLGLVSGAIGMGIALAAFDVLVASLPLPRALGDTLSLDWTAVASSFALAMVTGCAVSLAPMHGLLRGNLSGTAFGTRGSTRSNRGAGRLQNALVVSEVLMAVVLATGAALLVRTVGELRSLEWGLDPEGVMTVEVLMPEEGSSPAERPQFYQALLERAEAIPGVEAVGLIGRIPVRDGGWQGSISLADRPDLVDGQRPSAYFRPVSPGLFDAFDIEVLEGRGIAETDTRDGRNVAVVNESFARAMFPGQSAVGRVISRTGFLDGPIEIVGVIRNVAVDDLMGAVPMAAYYAWAQSFDESAYGILTLETSLEPGGLVEPLRAIVGELDSRVALGRTESMTSIVDGAMAEPLRLRFFLSMFSVLGIVLGAVGVYGVVTYTVQRRRAEYGIRMALGATPRRLLREVVRAGMLPVAVGVLAGSLVATMSARVLASFLFEVQPNDPTSLVAASGALLLSGVLAALVPAWRASSTDPSDALRAE